MPTLKQIVLAIATAIVLSVTPTIAAWAATVVEANQGAPGRYGAWPVSAAQSGTWTVGVSSAATSGVTTEVLMSSSTTTAVPSSPLSGRKAIEVQNLGPNAIFCCVGTGCTPVVNKSRRLSASGGGDSVWAIDATNAIPIRCLAATADQVTGAATIVSEVK